MFIFQGAFNMILTAVAAVTLSGRTDAICQKVRTEAIILVTRTANKPFYTTGELYIGRSFLER